MASWNEMNEGSDRSDDSATSTGCTGGEEAEEELKQSNTEDMERSCNEEVNRSKCYTVSWEKLLPKMMLRVLLVESDVSTRQIVAALLRKCSYRVVAASNGLKAWEILKERGHEIDLILTEVDLPSISGYALLSLIMEHEICKNIPVIMMSNQEAVSTVYKCMLRGACDYLIKPIRRNELRNLWQHVWRKHSLLAKGAGLLDKYIVQDKVEPACVDDGYFSQRKNEYFENGSDKQRSCMVVDVDAVGSQNVKKHQISTQNLLVQDNQARAPTSKDGTAITLDNVDKNADLATRDCSSESANFTGEEIDFMGAAPPHQSPTMHMESELDSCSNLDLSLRSYRPGGFEVQEPEDGNTLRHSSASSFTRYTGRKLFFQNSPSDPEEHAFVSEQVISSITDTAVPDVQVKECENENAFDEQNVVCTPRPESPCSENRPETSVKASDSNNETLQNGEKRFESWKDQGHSTNSSGHGSTCGSNSDVEQVTMIKAEAAESNNVRGAFTHIKTSARSEQREAAVARFRLKRKERCYDKKVRYESRRMLAEKRPRVKGQFVRQVPAAAPPIPDR